MRTAKDLIQFAGKPAVLASNGFRFPVRILDSREQAGKLEHLVEPVSGEGKDWVPAWMINLAESNNGEAKNNGGAKNNGEKKNNEERITQPVIKTHSHENENRRK